MSTTAISSTTRSVAEDMEATVRRYFNGVNEKDPDMIRSCFGETATIRDVCALNAADVDAIGATEARTVEADVLVQRCMEFLKAHPDCLVRFHYGPECGRQGDWVVAHWYEVGTWMGTSEGIGPPDGKALPMAVEGQTRFRVDPNQNFTIQEIVVTRTFTEWEKALLKKRKAEEAAAAAAASTAA